MLLLIIGEVTQQALLGQDYSITNALILIIVLMGTDLLLSKLKKRYGLLARIIEGAPLIVVENGKPLEMRMKKSGVDEEDVLESARLRFGITRMEEVNYHLLRRWLQETGIALLNFSCFAAPATAGDSTGAAGRPIPECLHKAKSSMFFAAL